MRTHEFFMRFNSSHFVNSLLSEPQQHLLSKEVFDHETRKTFQVCGFRAEALSSAVYPRFHVPVHHLFRYGETARPKRYFTNFCVCVRVCTHECVHWRREHIQRPEVDMGCPASLSFSLLLVSQGLLLNQELGSVAATL